MSSAADSSHQELAHCEAELADARRRYDALRSRKAVRAALALAELRLKAATLVRNGRRPASSERVPAPTRGSPIEPAPPVRAPDPGPAQPAPDPAPAAVAHCWPMGHFYSPVPDTVTLSRDPDRGRVWPQTPNETPGIAWREDEQVALVRDVLALQEELVFPTGPTGDPADYHTANMMFSRLDAWALQAMLRWLAPARMIEVGCGWSSLVAARVNREYLDGAMELTCVEPYPPDFLDDGVPGIARVLPVPVQDVPLSAFAELGEGDVLFIDSSHVAKTGSDCNYLYQQVLPRLRPGVAVHVHDIFLPRDYPPDWVLAGRGWNEQYVLQAFLAFNGAFQILLSNAWMSDAHPEVLAEAIPGFPASAPDGGGSIWLRRT